MGHLDDGTLRRLVDEGRASSLTEAEDRHLAGCPRCQARFAEIEGLSHAAAARLVGPAPSVDVAAGLARLQRRIDVEEAMRNRVWYERIRPMTQRWIKPVVAVAAVAAVVALLIFSPLGTYAQGFLNLFTPKQFVAVPVTQDQMQTLPDLSAYGTMAQNTPAKPQPMGSLDEAAQASGIHVVAPSSLPASVPNTPSYYVMPAHSNTFTFSAEKAKQTAIAKGLAAPAMPTNIDGSTLTVNANPVAIVAYGNSQMLNGMMGKNTRPASAPANGSSANAQAKAASPKETAAEANRVAAEAPSLVVMQTRAPVVTSSGVTVKELQQYLLSQPGISPQLAAAIESIADPNSTMPVPVPVNKVTSQTVTVQGVNGLMLGDSTGLGSIVMWQKDGIVYVVGGQVKDSEALSVANSLH
ncbi:MAG: hypothetical protein U0822_18085 [Anaerolineae bacterium]